MPGTSENEAPPGLAEWGKGKSPENFFCYNKFSFLTLHSNEKNNPQSPSSFFAAG
jgi:hypothetical protein